MRLSLFISVCAVAASLTEGAGTCNDVDFEADLSPEGLKEYVFQNLASTATGEWPQEDLTCPSTPSGCIAESGTITLLDDLEAAVSLFMQIEEGRPPQFKPGRDTFANAFADIIITDHMARLIVPCTTYNNKQDDPVLAGAPPIPPLFWVDYNRVRHPAVGLSKDEYVLKFVSQPRATYIDSYYGTTKTYLDLLTQWSSVQGHMACSLKEKYDETIAINQIANYTDLEAEQNQMEFLNLIQMKWMIVSYKVQGAYFQYPNFSLKNYNYPTFGVARFLNYLSKGLPADCIGANGFIGGRCIEEMRENLRTTSQVKKVASISRFDLCCKCGGGDCFASAPCASTCHSVDFAPVLAASTNQEKCESVARLFGTGRCLNSCTANEANEIIQCAKDTHTTASSTAAAAGLTEQWFTEWTGHWYNMSAAVESDATTDSVCNEYTACPAGEERIDPDGDPSVYSPCVRNFITQNGCCRPNRNIPTSKAKPDSFEVHGDPDAECVRTCYRHPQCIAYEIISIKKQGKWTNVCEHFMSDKFAYVTKVFRGSKSCRRNAICGSQDFAAEIPTSAPTPAPTSTPINCVSEFIELETAYFPMDNVAAGCIGNPTQGTKKGKQPCRTVATSAEACYDRCAQTVGCVRINFWSNGGCHLVGPGATVTSNSKVASITKKIC